MKRWVVCKKWDNPDGGGIEPVVSKYTQNFRMWERGEFPWVICQIGIKDPTPVQADPDCHVLPDLSFDTLLSSLTQAQRNALRNRLIALGVNVETQNIPADWSVRDLLRWLGRKLQPTMEPERGDVSDF